MLTAAPYAMSLLPGATMVDSEADADYAYSLRVNSYYRSAFNATTSVANGVGVSGVADGLAEDGEHPKGVYGFSEAGYGVYGASEDYVGVYGEGVTGVYGDGSTQSNSVGVFGKTAGADSFAVYGASSGVDSPGVFGVASGDTTCAWDATFCSAGVTGRGFGTHTYGLFAYSHEYTAIYGVTPDTGIWTSYSRNLGGADSPALGVNGYARVYGDLTVEGLIYGTLAPLAINAGFEPLQRGDVVVVVGMDTPLHGNTPVMRVMKATPETASAIVGVVSVLYESYDRTPEEVTEGQVPGRFNHEVTTIQPGEYLGVVTEGVFQWLKVDASNMPIHAGDLLSISSTAGVAAKAQQITIDGYSFYAPGTIIGKALQDLDSGTGIIAVFVSLK
jgi:hypothetical protein